MSEMAKRPFKDALYEQFARIGKALANPKRLELIDVLAQGERTVESLAEEIEQSVANTSQHLQTLKAAQLLEVRRDGLYAHYRLADERVFGLWRALRDLGEARLAEVERVVSTFLEGRGDMETIDADALLERLERDEAVVLDVRPADEYRAGHVAGALSIPSDELEARLEEVPRDKPVVAYCRGPYCVFADEAVALLRTRGVRAARLREGFPEWRAAGLPVSERDEG